MNWIWKTKNHGERRGRGKAHAFEASTRRSLCRKYDDGPSWIDADVAPGVCAVCWKEAARQTNRGGRCCTLGGTV
jgi:hypothetical protein